LLILKRWNRQNVLEQVIKQNQGVELKIRVITIVDFERLAYTLNDHLSDVEALSVDEIGLHDFELSASVALGFGCGGYSKFVLCLGVAVCYKVCPDDL
jgi:hypothetical protein